MRMTDQTDPTDAPPEPRAHAFVFPGQGSQYVGMGTALLERSPAAAAVMERADAALGFSLSRLIAEGPAEELDLTVNAQPAILATSVAYLEAMRAEAREAGVELAPLRVAGHSAGQYAAAVAADAIDFETAIGLVRERGRIMQERGIEGGMGAVIGLTDEQVHEVVDAAREHGEIGVANANAPGQIVLSGVIPALAFALEMSKTVGARKAVRLTVSVASHSPLMRRARDEFSQILAKVPFREPRVPMLGNVHATVIRTADGLRRELSEHLVHGVQWTETIRRMAADGVTDFVEIGPGRVLSGLIKRIAPEATTHALDAAGQWRAVAPRLARGERVTARRVVVTGLGVVSPVGIGAAPSWDALVAGRSGIADITLFDTTDYEIHVAGEVKGFDASQYMDGKDVRRHDRNTHFAVAAAGEALRDAGLLTEDGMLDTGQADPDRFGMIVGTAIGGIGMISDGVATLRDRGPGRISPFLLPHMIPDAASGMVAIQYGIRGPNMAVVSACATGGHAIGEAMETIVRGQADLMLGAGTEAVIVPLAFAGLRPDEGARLADRPRHRRIRPDDRLAPVRCHPRRLRRVGGMRGAGARGDGPRARARCASDRRGDRLRLEQRRLPHGRARRAG